MPVRTLTRTFNVRPGQLEITYPCVDLLVAAFRQFVIPVMTWEQVRTVAQDVFGVEPVTRPDRPDVLLIPLPTTAEHLWLQLPRRVDGTYEFRDWLWTAEA